MDPGPTTFPLSSAGTNALTLGGSGTVSLGGANPQNVAITGGFFDIAAPKTSCSALEASCPTLIDQAEIDFADFAFSGHSVVGLRLYLDEQVLTASGTFVPSANRFIFTIPQGVNFDAVATVDGQLTGLIVTSSQEVNGSIDLATGKLAFQFDVTGPFAGQTLEASGTALSAEVVALAPTVTAPADISVNANANCEADVTLTASASSPTGQPVTLTFTVDNTLAGTGSSVTKTLSAGTHHVLIVGLDALGMRGTASQTVVVHDVTPPTITAPPNATITSCANPNIGQATASDTCGGAVTVTNDAPPTFPLGTTTVTWTATDAAGNKATAQQKVTAVLGDDASCCPAGTNVIVGTDGADTITGTSGADCILGRGGNDTINAQGGNDFISGGAGQDTINAGDGNDVVFGGDDDDVIDSGAGDDFIDGGNGTDNCSGSSGTNSIANCEVAAFCTATCCVSNSCAPPSPTTPQCSSLYAQSNCLSYVQGTVVSFSGHNWECTNGNCANCATFASCAPGASGCPWGVVWTDRGAVAPGCP